jgi:hypothetical protein
MYNCWCHALQGKPTCVCHPDRVTQNHEFTETMWLVQHGPVRRFSAWTEYGTTARWALMWSMCGSGYCLIIDIRAGILHTILCEAHIPRKLNGLDKGIIWTRVSFWISRCHTYNNKEYLKEKVSQNLKFRANMMPYMILFFEILTWKSMWYYKGK